MDDNFQYAQEQILSSLKEAREYTEELYEEELGWKVDKILSDAESKVKKTLDRHSQKWIPPHNETGRMYRFI